mmetsp:Transcript_15477/g.37199  ORF Transcript_15477/g.37199 Transcript_15477/m.37199 type:complete len:203 (-) Transcript_15477:14-622(-)
MAMDWAPFHEKEFGAGCLCLPRRSSVFVVALLTILYGVFAMAGLYTTRFQWFLGGFTEGTAIAGGVVGVLAMIFGLVGINGCADRDAAQLRLLYHFLCSAILVTAVLATLDYLHLNWCESWGVDFSASQNRVPDLGVPPEGKGCVEHRGSFIALTVVRLLIGCYFAYEVGTLAGLLHKKLGAKIQWWANSTKPTRQRDAIQA